MNIAGILIASGASRRLGRPKQLLAWRGGFLINSLISTLQATEISELLVVLGHARNQVEKIIPANTLVINNEDWRRGKSTSIKAGLLAVAKSTNAVIFFTVDQPFLSSALVDRIIDCSGTSSAQIVATRAHGVETAPMLFKAECFSALMQLDGEQGGKSILKSMKFDSDFVDWADEKVLIDIDTEEDYQTALRLDK